jgi:hypothetical protein
LADAIRRVLGAGRTIAVFAIVVNATGRQSVSPVSPTSMKSRWVY